MDVKQLSQSLTDMFNDSSYKTKAKDIADPHLTVSDPQTGQELHGPEGLAQYFDGYHAAMPDVKAAPMDEKVNGNKVTTRIRGTGTFTGSLQTPQGNVPGNGKKLDTTYTVEQEYNEAGKLIHWSVKYDLQDFMKQLGVG